MASEPFAPDAGALLQSIKLAGGDLRLEALRHLEALPDLGCLPGLADALAAESADVRAAVLAALADLFRLAEGYTGVVETALRLTGGERGFVALHEPESATLVPQAALNVDPRSVTSDESSAIQTVADRVASGGEAMLTTNMDNDPRFTGAGSMASYAIRTVLCAPFGGGQTGGIIYVDRRIRAGLFQPPLLPLFRDFARLVGQVVQAAGGQPS